jgi:hypothetical protein
LFCHHDRDGLRKNWKKGGLRSGDLISGVYVDVGGLEERKADEHGEDIWPAQMSLLKLLCEPDNKKRDGFFWTVKANEPGEESREMAVVDVAMLARDGCPFQRPDWLQLSQPASSLRARRVGSQQMFV